MRVRLAWGLAWMLLVGAAGDAAANWNEPSAGSLNASTSQFSDSASAATVGGTPYVAWNEDDGSTVYQIRVKRLDGGAWAPVGGSLNVATNHNAYYPRIAS